MTTDRRSRALGVALAAALLLWPALLNGYPLVFADTGTYLSQAIDRYLGWDRPVFYSLFLYPLHLQRTLWPVVVAQAWLTAWTLSVLLRCVLPGAPVWALPALMAALSLATPLPWIVCQIMPDCFTALLVIVLTLLILHPARLRRGEALAFTALGVLAVAVHTSHVPLALGLIAVLLPLRRVLGGEGRLGRQGYACIGAVPAIAVGAMMAVNLVGHGRAAVAPFGNVFLLARVLYDGPGMAALDRRCPAVHWRLCGYVGQFPSDSDHFLWDRHSPLWRAGGPKAVSLEADAIIMAALRDAPTRVLNRYVGNVTDQLARFATGDGLQPWPATVRPIIARSFPASELQAYDASRQSGGLPLVAEPLRLLHRAAATAGLAALCAMPIVARRRVAGGLAVAVLLALLGNAMITGGLSQPHDRYQARLIWLAVAAPLLALPLLPQACRRRAEALPA